MIFLQGLPTRAPATETTVLSLIGEYCTQEGFLADPRNCKKFYRCVNNGNGGLIRYEFACGPNTVWDVDTISCNYPYVNKREICRNQVEQPPATLAPIENTTQNLVSTTDGLDTNSRITTDSGYGTSGSTSWESTTYIASITTDLGIPNTLETQSTGTYSTFTTSVPVDSTTYVPGTSAPCPISQLEGNQISLVCPTGFRRHPKYCNLFYQCSKSNSNHDFKILVLSCPDGTIYDDKKIQCLPSNETEPCAGQIAQNAFYKILSDNSLPPVSIPIQNESLF